MRLRGVHGCLLISVPPRMLERLSARALFRLPTRHAPAWSAAAAHCRQTTRHRSAAGSLNWVTAADVAASLPLSRATATDRAAAGGVLRAPVEPGVPRNSVSYTHLRAHETRHDLVCRL